MEDLTCQRFGNLISVDRTGESENGSDIWRCLCDCDRVVYLPADELLSGERSCCDSCKSNRRP